MEKNTKPYSRNLIMKNKIPEYELLTFMMREAFSRTSQRP